MEMKKLALASAIALLTGTAQADPLSWNEIGVGYNRADGGENTTDAVDIQGSIGLGELFHSQLTYLDGTAEDGGEGGGGPDFDFDGYDARLGVNPFVGEKTQAVVDLIYFDYDGDLGTAEDGWGLGFGLRHQIGDKFELRGEISYIDGTFEQGGTFGTF